MRITLPILLLIFYLTGCCCLERPRNDAVYLSPNGKPFPTAWGRPPDIQTKDYRPLPYGYGHGSSTLHHWILKQQWDFGERGKRDY